jgi:3-deoxy-D-manno-octulosonic-acid transferase
MTRPLQAEGLMLWLYRLFFVPALLLVLPYYLLRMLRRGGYARHFAHRLGLYGDVPSKPAAACRIWVHAVSVGEVLALAPLLRLLREDAAQTQIVLTTTTSTAFAQAERAYGPVLAYLGYFPLDFWPFSVQAWKRLQPELCLLMEGEIWPEHLHQASLRGVPVCLINARMSERSHRRWAALPRFMRFPFAEMTRIVAASQEDANRYAQLVPATTAITVSGNLKLDFSPAPLLSQPDIDGLRRELGLHDVNGQGAALVLAGGSTWPGEEEMLLRVLAVLRDHSPRVKLLLIPRHAERRKAVRAMLARTSWNVHFRGQGRADGPVDVCVADTTGEMVALLQTADIVFVGKSMPPHHGGQNPVEAAALGKAVVFGPHMENFQAIAKAMLRVGAAWQGADEQHLTQRCKELLLDPGQRDAQGRKARVWHQSGQGAARRTCRQIRDLLGNC